MKIKTLLVIWAFLFTGSVFADPNSIMVIGEMNPDVDVSNVQYAVNNYENVILSGEFDFGMYGSVEILHSVKIHGAMKPNGFPSTVIHGGMLTFNAPVPALQEGEFLDPGPAIEIKNIHFDGALMMPLSIGYTSGIEIKNTKITNVSPITDVFPTGVQVGIYIGPSDFFSVVPGAVTGRILVMNNEIDPALGTGVFSFPIVLNGTSGAVVKDNKIVVQDGFDVDTGLISAGIFNNLSNDALIAGNHITIKPSSVPQSAWWGGVGILNSSNDVTITRNTITFDKSYTYPLHSNAAICQNGSGATIFSNTIEGFGFASVGLFSPAANNLILNNDLKNFESWGADVIFGDTGVSNNTLIGKGGTVLDWGTGNTVIGDWTVN